MSMVRSSYPGGGRDGAGRFARGNAGGPGNPYAAASAALRKRLYRAITEEDVEAAVAAMRSIMNDAKGDPRDRISAARELLDRAVGKPKETIEQELAVLAQRGEGLDMGRATPEELRTLREIRARIAERTACPECREERLCANHRG